MRPAIKITLAGLPSPAARLAPAGQEVRRQRRPRALRSCQAPYPRRLQWRPSTPPQASPVVKKRIVTSRRAIPFKTMRVNDSALSKGRTRVRNPGARGIEILTYKVTLRNGIQTHKELVRKVIARAPVTRVVAVGTKEIQQCDPNYSGACVPIASDVDCAGGSGNGPAYVQGPVQVIGTDIYGLDRDGDGIGCEDD